MTTKSYYDARVYLNNSYQFQCDDNIHVISCEAIPAGGAAKFGASTHKILLDKTIFHPQGLLHFRVLFRVFFLM
jgi:hypothetical protein